MSPFNTVIIPNHNFPVTQQVKINRETNNHDNGPTNEVISDKIKGCMICSLQCFW